MKDNNITDYRNYGIEVSPAGTTFYACQYGKRISWALNSWTDAERWIDGKIAEQFISDHFEIVHIS